MSINMRFTEEDWQRHEQTWKAWWAGELDRPTVIIPGFEARSTAPLPDAPGFAAHLGMDMPADEVIDRYQAHLEAEGLHRLADRLGALHRARRPVGRM